MISREEALIFSLLMMLQTGVTNGTYQEFIEFKIMQSTKIILYGLLIGSLLIGCNQGKKQKAKEKANSEKRLVVTNSDALEMLIGLGASENIVRVNDDDIIMKHLVPKPWPSIGSWRNLILKLL